MLVTTTIPGIPLEVTYDSVQPQGVTECMTDGPTKAMILERLLFPPRIVSRPEQAYEIKAASNGLGVFAVCD